MIQAESDALGCVCPQCGYRCRDCLGTDTVVSRDRLSSLAADPRFSQENLRAIFEDSVGETRYGFGTPSGGDWYGFGTPSGEEGDEYDDEEKWKGGY